MTLRISQAVSNITCILDAIQRGDPKAADELLPLVYQELRKLAAHKMANELPGQTLQAIALVHEAWLRLIENGAQRRRRFRQVTTTPPHKNKDARARIQSGESLRSSPHSKALCAARCFVYHADCCRTVRIFPVANLRS